jgi:hypothetical protein
MQQHESAPEGQPTKPPHAFATFCQFEAYSCDDADGSSSSSSFSAHGEKWQGLSAASRNYYEEEAARLRQDYKRELAAWNAKQQASAALAASGRYQTLTDAS